MHAPTQMIHKRPIATLRHNDNLGSLTKTVVNGTSAEESTVAVQHVRFGFTVINFLPTQLKFLKPIFGLTPIFINPDLNTPAAFAPKSIY